MRIDADTLDDVLLRLYPELLARGSNVNASRGENAEIIGVLLEIRCPRARLSRSETRGRPFSSLGELLWYLTADNRLEFIEQYIPRYRDESEDEGNSVYGGYGPRLFNQRGCDQIRNVIALLRDRPSSRRAVVQLFNAEDIAEPHREIPCTTTLQFFRRDDRVHAIATLRSNDAYLGLPHDVFCFTMLQEIVARSLGCEIGVYRHFAGSMHIYDKHRTSAQRFVEECYQARVEMPPMPLGDPWSAIKTVLKTEARIRARELVEANELGLDPYWSDLVRLLQIVFSPERAGELRDNMSFRAYRSYIEFRIGRSNETT